MILRPIPIRFQKRGQYLAFGVRLPVVGCSSAGTSGDYATTRLNLAEKRIVSGLEAVAKQPPKERISST
jgi:hypothetical protein